MLRIVYMCYRDIQQCSNLCKFWAHTKPRTVFTARLWIQTYNNTVTIRSNVLYSIWHFHCSSLMSVKSLNYINGLAAFFARKIDGVRSDRLTLLVCRHHPFSCPPHHWLHYFVLAPRLRYGRSSRRRQLPIVLFTQPCPHLLGVQADQCSVDTHHCLKHAQLMFCHCEKHATMMLAYIVIIVKKLRSLQCLLKTTSAISQV